MFGSAAVISSCAEEHPAAWFRIIASSRLALSQEFYDRPEFLPRSSFPHDEAQMAPSVKLELLPAQAPEHPEPDREKQNVREPDEKLGVEFVIRAQGVGDDDEEEVEDADDQAGGEAE